MDDYLPLALAIVLSINAVLFISQLSIDNLSTDINVTDGKFYNISGSLICKVDSSNCEGDKYVLNDTDPTNLYPESEPIESGDGGLFTDMFGSIVTFFSDKLGLGYIIDILSAPKTFLTMMGLPYSISFVLSAMWYLFTLLIILAFFWGR